MRLRFTNELVYIMVVGWGMNNIRAVEGTPIVGQELVKSGESLANPGDKYVMSGHKVVYSGENPVMSGHKVVHSGENHAMSGHKLTYSGDNAAKSEITHNPTPDTSHLLPNKTHSTPPPYNKRTIK